MKRLFLLLVCVQLGMGAWTQTNTLPEPPRTWAFDQPVEKVQRRIDRYVERHQADPQWLLSRMAMYWKEGEHFTQCYIRREHWHHGEGNAPVPTLRLPGERTWNKSPRPRLSDLQPYNETGDLTVTDAKTASQKKTKLL